MDKRNALEEFYSKNNINHLLVSDKESAEFDNMLFDLDCKIDKWLSYIDESDREIFCQVLSKYTYLTETACQKRYEKIVDNLLNHLRSFDISLDKVLFITVESKNGTKSGSEHICADFYKRNRVKGIQKSQMISSFSRFNIASIRKYQAIVFLDDIVGSGFTLSNAIHNVIETLKDEVDSLSTIHLYAACLVLSTRGKRMIDRNAKKGSYEITWLIDETYYAQKMFKTNSTEYEVFEKYEYLIDDYINDNKSYFMGFEKGKLGISFHYNTPNNTLSTFWCETDINKPPFKRDGDQPQKRLKINDLKQIKQQTDYNAYNAAIAREPEHEC